MWKRPPLPTAGSEPGVGEREGGDEADGGASGGDGEHPEPTPGCDGHRPPNGLI